MAETMRGMRLGSQSMESEFGVEMAQRQKVEFRCAKNHEFELVFSAEAELPQTWECNKCDQIAIRLEDGNEIAFEGFAQEEKRTHFDMVLERRTRQELEELLEEMLQQMRERRASGRLSA
jgi:hypothetical protein